ncbi:MAG: hypothetical protein ACRD1P_11560 [Thermoanaerobaculia bacterium]
MVIDETKRAYLAGIIDGEGTIGILKVKPKDHRNVFHYAVVEVSNTNSKLIEWLTVNVGCQSGCVVQNRTKLDKSGEKCKPLFRIAWRSLQAERVIRIALPYLVLKREQAELVLRLRSTMQKKGGVRVSVSKEVFLFRESLFQRIKKLNTRGITDAERLSERMHEADKLLRAMRQSGLTGKGTVRGEVEEPCPPIQGKDRS